MEPALECAQEGCSERGRSLALKKAMNKSLRKSTHRACFVQLRARDTRVHLEAAKNSAEKHIPSLRGKTPGVCDGK